MTHLGNILHPPNFNQYSLRTNYMPLFSQYVAISEIAALFREEGVATLENEESKKTSDYCFTKIILKKTIGAI